MKPVANERTTSTRTHPQYDGETKLHLSVEEIEGVGIRSFWKPTDAELAQLAAGGVVELILWGDVCPPVSLEGISMLDATKPFVD